MKKILINFLFLSLIVFLSSCGEEEEKPIYTNEFAPGERVAYTPSKDEDIQQYNLEQQRMLSTSNSPCDTLALKEFILDNYEPGTYLVDFDQTFTYNIPNSAVIYYKKNNNLIFGIIAKSKPGERLIEPDNIVGFNQSFIDLDSTDLGVAFFYLVLFECTGNNFQVIWEAPIPSHGGLREFNLNKWIYKGTQYMRVDFYYARGSGHIDYNYFFIDGIRSKPHLLMTYWGIDFRRTIANVNNDKYPDYYEYIYYNTGDRIAVLDSIPFYWSVKDTAYISTRDHSLRRPY
ncbi:MAG: hypothetical protein IIB83_03195 [Bacteroidetes bacterium]|nr:hypothetical protein [Bacteroidota bacterium]